MLELGESLQVGPCPAFKDGEDRGVVEAGFFRHRTQRSIPDCHAEILGKATRDLAERIITRQIGPSGGEVLREQAHRSRHRSMVDHLVRPDDRLLLLPFGDRAVK